MVSLFAIIGRDDARSDTESRRSAFAIMMPNSCKGTQTFLATARMVSRMANRNTAMFSVLVM